MGTATCYQTCYNSLMDFDKKLSLEKITGDLLYEYENWMLAKGKSITTVGIGHRDVKTTENYLDSFENEMKKEFSGKLSAFKKNGLRKTA